MKNKKIIILIILSVFAVISIICGITAKPRSRAGNPAIKGSEPFLPKQGAISVERMAKRSKFSSWKRSPFAEVGTAAPAAKLVLSGIIWNKDKPKAMIGDLIVGKGDKVGENTVVDIKPDKVILNDGTKDFELKIEK